MIEAVPVWDSLPREDRESAARAVEAALEAALRVLREKGYVAVAQPVTVSADTKNANLANARTPDETLGLFVGHVDALVVQLSRLRPVLATRSSSDLATQLLVTAAGSFGYIAAHSNVLFRDKIAGRLLDLWADAQGVSPWSGKSLSRAEIGTISAIFAASDLLIAAAYRRMVADGKSI